MKSFFIIETDEDLTANALTTKLKGKIILSKKTINIKRIRKVNKGYFITKLFENLKEEFYNDK